MKEKGSEGKERKVTILFWGGTEECLRKLMTGKIRRFSV